jgi:hypothetical protein
MNTIDECYVIHDVRSLDSLFANFCSCAVVCSYVHVVVYISYKQNLSLVGIRNTSVETNVIIFARIAEKDN